MRSMRGGFISRRLTEDGMLNMHVYVQAFHHMSSSGYYAFPVAHGICQHTGNCDSGAVWTRLPQEQPLNAPSARHDQIHGTQTEEHRHWGNAKVRSPESL